MTMVKFGDFRARRSIIARHSAGHSSGRRALKVEQPVCNERGEWTRGPGDLAGASTQLAIVFGSPADLPAGGFLSRQVRGEGGGDRPASWQASQAATC